MIYKDFQIDTHNHVAHGTGNKKGYKVVMQHITKDFIVHKDNVFSGIVVNISKKPYDINDMKNMIDNYFYK